EESGQRVVTGIEVVQAALQRTDRTRVTPVAQRTLECIHRVAELTGLRTVLSVVDDQVLAPSEAQTVVAGTWLGLWHAGRHDEGTDVSRQAPFAYGALRLVVIRLQQEDHVELRTRIVEPIDRGEQLPDHVGLTIGRYEDRV
ncbi:hypothetical protein ABE10_00195, partial [Bacillus toyonensis]|nr:hypothetical protein [Bacillus toyonensis]